MQGRAFGMSAAVNRAGVYDGKIAGLYDLEETLGSGHFAVVKLARHVFTGEKVAVKVIEKTKLDEISRAHLFQEVRCMKLVQHPHVVRLYEVIDTQTKLYLILELGDGGDLYDYIMRHDKGLSEHVAQEYFRQIVRAISYCHQLHVVHRDLKPENVVFFEKLGVVKLTDFGFSNKFCPGQKLETSCGSLAYSAPEILLGDSYDAPAVDVWSLGVILFMLVCGHPPFQEANDSETLTMIMDCKYTMPEHVSEGCRRLISTMLVREPENRATLQQIAQDPWLLEGSSTEEIPEYLPLVSREQVSEEDHALILQKMVNGKIATKEDILEALDRNEYNHITATYFLLAERKLRAHRQEEAQKRKPELTLPVSSSARLQNFRKDSEDDPKEDSLLPPKLGMLLSVPRTPGTETGQGRNRKCSIVQEEEDDEDDVTGAGHEELSTPLNRRGSRSEGRINVTVQDRIAESERLKQEASAAAAGAIACSNNVPNADDCPFEDGSDRTTRQNDSTPDEEEAGVACGGDSKQVADCTNVATTTSGSTSGSKPKGFSARIFHTFKKQHPSSNSSTPSSVDGGERTLEVENGGAATGNDIEIMVELKKAYAASESNNSKSTKKIKILGRYFQVHKKFYVPLSGLFQRGRLYKAQSCGSIVRDKVNVNPNGGSGAGGTTRGGTNARHSTIFNEKNRFIKNCLSGSRLLGSDGDINHNGNSFITLPPGAATAAMTNGSVSPVDHQQQHPRGDI